MRRTSGLLLLLVLGLSVNAQTTVSPANLNGWTLSASSTAATGFQAGPATPPLGIGSGRMSVGADGNGASQFRTSLYNGMLMSSMTALSYSTFVQQTGSGGQAPYIILNLDYDNNGTNDDLLFYEPVYQSATFCPSNPSGPQADGVWQTWNAFAGCWYSVFGTAGSGPGTNTMPLATILAGQPNARLTGSATSGSLRLVAGFGAGAWDNFIGNVDNVSVGFSGSTTTFDFEPTQTVLVVTPSNLQGWVPVTSGTSTITFEPGPATPPLGGGSVELAVGSDGSGAAQLRHPSMDGTLLADLTQLSYSAYVDQDGSGGQAPYIILSVDYDGNGTTDDLLFFEPIYQGATFCPSNVQGPLVVDTWQTWNATAGCWWSLNNTAGAGPGTNVKPLSTILAAQPNARLATDTTGAIRIVAGFGAGAWDNFIGNVDNVSIGSGSTSTVYDFEPEPAITIADIAQNEGNAGTTNFVFTLTLSQAVSQTVTVQYATADGTATVADGDYIATSGTATFAPGTTTTTVTVQVVGDVKLEADETFFLNLTSPQLATVTPPDDQAQATILNDDPVPTITITDVTQAEGNAGTTNFVFTLALSNPSATTVTVNAATADGTASSASDYTAVNTIVTFAPGTVVQTVSVPVIGDLVLETDETFFVNLSGATGATILDNQGLGTITNDDAAPTFSINDVSQAEGDAGTTAFTFTVTLTGSSALTATVDFATADGTATAGTDYTATSGTLTFAPGVTTQTITVNVTGDVTFEPDETFFVNLSNPTNATISDAQGLGTITTDDAGVADLSITKSGTATQFQGQAISYTITVSNAGPQDAPNTIVTDTLPAGSTFGSATPSQGSCTGTGPVTCNLGVVANGATATITLTVTAPFTGTTATNTATVTSGASDPDLTDNTATATTTLTPAAAIPTLSQWMLLALAAMFAVTALLRLRM